MRRPSRRVAVVAASLTAVALAGAVVAVVTRPADSQSALVPLDDASAYTPDVAVPATETPSPTPSETVSPTATARPVRSTEPATAAPTSASAAPTYSGAFGPRPPGSVTLPYRAGQTAWDATSNGIHIHVALSSGAKAGSPVTWTVSTSSSRGGCCAVYLLFGDGYAATPGMECEDRDPTRTWTHVYNRGGRHEFMVQAGDKTGCGNANDGSLYGSFDLGAGPATPQGPSLPTVTFDRSTPVKGHEQDPHYVSLYGEAHDVDGHLTKLVVTFGDGTSKTFAGDTNACVETKDGWPGDSMAWLPYDPAPAYHRYTAPGTYTLTLTAYSAGCDGGGGQTGTASFEWTVPEPEPTATPTPTATA